MRIALVPIVLSSALIFVACGPSQAFRRASAAEQAGDWPTAVQSYRTALVDDPDDEEVRAALVNAELQLVASTVAGVQEGLALLDYPQVVSIHSEAVNLMPGNPTLEMLEEAIQTSALDDFNGALQAGHARQVFEQSELLVDYLPERTALGDVRAAARQEFAVQLQARAEFAEEEDRLGDAYLAWIQVAALVPNAPGSERSRGHRTRIRDEITYRYKIEYDGVLSGAAPPIVQGALAVSTNDADESLFSLRCEQPEPDITETYTASIALHSYLAGYREVPNPYYNTVWNRFSDAEASLIRAESDLISAEEDYFRAEEDRAEHIGEADYDTYHRRWESAHQTLTSRRNQVQDRREDVHDIRSDLNRTPPTVTEEVWDDFPYEVREYARRAEAVLWYEITRDGARPHQYHETLSTETTDLEHAGFPHVGIASDPLSYPLSESELEDAMRNRGLERIGALVLEDFSAYRTGYLEGGLELANTDRDSAVEALVRYVLLNPGNIDPSALTALDELADLWDASVLD